MSRPVWWLVLAVLVTVLGAVAFLAGLWAVAGWPWVLMVGGAGLVALGLLVVPS